MTLSAFLIDNDMEMTILHRILPYQVVGVFIQIALPGSKAKIRRQHPGEGICNAVSPLSIREITAYCERYKSF